MPDVEHSTTFYGTVLMEQSKQFRLGYLVHDVSRLRRTVLDKVLKPMGITRSQWWVLSNLARNKSHEMRQTELAKVLDLGKVALGGLIDRLEAAGYVVRTGDPNDRRAKHITMTKRGEELLSLMTERAQSINEVMNSDLLSEEIEAAEDILHRMKQRLILIDSELRQGGQVDDMSPSLPSKKKRADSRPLAA